jgi:hypothetical protein
MSRVRRRIDPAEEEESDDEDKAQASTLRRGSGHLQVRTSFWPTYCVSLVKAMPALKMTLVTASPGQRRRTRRNYQYLRLRILMHLDVFMPRVVPIFRKGLLMYLDVFLLLLFLFQSQRSKAERSEKHGAERSWSWNKGGRILTARSLSRRVADLMSSTACGRGISISTTCFLFLFSRLFWDGRGPGT